MLLHVLALGLLAQIFPLPTPPPAPSPAPSASPAATPRPGSITLDASAHITFVSQSTNGFGTFGLPEGPGCQSGMSPAARWRCCSSAS